MLGSAPLRAVPGRAAQAPPVRAPSRPGPRPAPVRAPAPARSARPRRGRRCPTPPSARAARRIRASADRPARRTAAGSARPARRPPRARRSRGSPGGPARRGPPARVAAGSVAARLAGRAPGKPRLPNLNPFKQNAAGRLGLIFARKRTARRVHAGTFACRWAAATRGGRLLQLQPCSVCAALPAHGAAARQVPLSAAPQQGPLSSTGRKESL